MGPVEWAINPERAPRRVLISQGRLVVPGRPSGARGDDDDDDGGHRSLTKPAKILE